MRSLRAARARLRPSTPAPSPRLVGASVIPTVRYRDVPKAVDWLCRAFGMQVHRVVTDADGAPCYAELTVGSGMLMVAPIEDTPFGKLMVQPDEIGGVETQVCYLCVTNARTHYKRAKAAGAVILLDPDDEANRGRGYSCRDPEGHVWNFGTYDPWAGQTPAPAAPAAMIWRWRPGGSLGRLQQGLAALVVLAAAGVLLPQLMPQPSARAGTAAVASLPPAAPSPLDEVRPEPVATPAQVTAEHETRVAAAAIEAAERTAAAARAELAEIRAALARTERDAAAARVQADELRRSREAAERAAAEARAHLAAAQQSAEQARVDAAQERARRLAAIRAATPARRPAAVNVMRPRARWARSWCYNPNVPRPASSGPGRLIGFCGT
jgi:uncharacterized glyoxalase superfamily protein PhnB